MRRRRHVANNTNLGHGLGSDEIPERPPPASLTDALAQSLEDDDASAYSEDLGDHADEYSRRLSGVPLNGRPGVDSPLWDQHTPRQDEFDGDDSSEETLVYPQSTPLPRHLPPSPSRRRVSGAQAAQNGTNMNPFAGSPRQTYQARTARMSPATPELGYDDYWEGDTMDQPESPPNFPRALRTSTAREASWVSEPLGEGIGQLKRRATLSSGGRVSDGEEEDYGFYKDVLEKHHGLDLGASDRNDKSSSISSLRDEKDRGHSAYSSALDKLHHWNDDSSSAYTNDEVVMDPDDPRVTGAKPNHLEEKALEKEMLSKMDYRTRRKHLQRMRIEYNIACRLHLVVPKPHSHFH